MRGGGKCSSPALTHRLRRPPLTEGKDYLLDDGFCDFAFGSAQNDRGERHTEKSESVRTGETKHKGVWCYAHWQLMLFEIAVDTACTDF